MCRSWPASGMVSTRQPARRRRSASASATWAERPPRMQRMGRRAGLDHRPEVLAAEAIVKRGQGGAVEPPAVRALDRFEVHEQPVGGRDREPLAQQGLAHRPAVGGLRGRGLQDLEHPRGAGEGGIDRAGGDVEQHHLGQPLGCDAAPPPGPPDRPASGPPGRGARAARRPKRRRAPRGRRRPDRRTGAAGGRCRARAGPGQGCAGPARGPRAAAPRSAGSCPIPRKPCSSTVPWLPSPTVKVASAPPEPARGSTEDMVDNPNRPRPSRRRERLGSGAGRR